MIIKMMIREKEKRYLEGKDPVKVVVVRIKVKAKKKIKTP